MKKMTTAAVLAGGAILASQSAFAQATANDLYLGFQDGPDASADYIINLGAASGIVGSSSVVDLSGDFSLSDFDTVLGSSSSLMGGVVGVFQTSGSNPAPDMYATQLRSDLGIPSMPGSAAPGDTSKSVINLSASPVLGGLDGPAAGTGVLDSSKSWQAVVEPGTASQNFYRNSGVNPDSSVSPSSVLYEDLWYVSDGTLTDPAAWTYEGYFTLDLTGSNPSLTFTPQSVPEPTILGLLGGAGCLLLSFRRRLKRNNA